MCLRLCGTPRHEFNMIVTLDHRCNTDGFVVFISPLVDAHHATMRSHEYLGASRDFRR